MKVKTGEWLYVQSTVKLISLSLALLIAIPSEKLAHAFLFPAGLIHFWFSFYYAAPELRRVQKAGGGWRLFSFLILSALMAAYYSPLVSTVIFGLHFVMSEAYYGLGPGGKKAANLLLPRSFFEAAVYFTVLFKTSLLALPWFAYMLVTLSFLYLIQSIKKSKSLLGTAQANDILASHVVSLVAFIICFAFLDLPGTHMIIVLVLLHGGTWAFYPMVKDYGKIDLSGAKEVAFYFVATIVLIAVLTPQIMRDETFFRLTAIFYSFWVNIHMFQGFIASPATSAGIKKLLISHRGLR